MGPTARADNESLKGVFYSIDQGATPTNITSITLKRSAIKVSITPLNGTFEGILSGEGNTIKGSWTQGGPALPFNLVRATNETAWTIPEPPPPPIQMPANARPEFTVATIKPSRPDAPRGVWFPGPGCDHYKRYSELAHQICLQRACPSHHRGSGVA